MLARPPPCSTSSPTLLWQAVLLAPEVVRLRRVRLEVLPLAPRAPLAQRRPSRLAPRREEAAMPRLRHNPLLLALVPEATESPLEGLVLLDTDANHGPSLSAALVPVEQLLTCVKGISQALRIVNFFETRG